MEIIQLIKKLNNTELGKGGTHDTYVLVPQNLDISDLFPVIDEKMLFINKQNGEVINIRHTVGREKRIVGLGTFYSQNDLCAGDEIVLEKQILQGESEYYINFNKRTNILILQKIKNGFEILTSDRKNLITDDTIIKIGNRIEKISIEYVASEKKRQDSPIVTDFYDVKIGGGSILNQYSGKELVEIEINNNEARINRFCSWKKYRFEVEEDNG